ncbi:MAG: hypothetical protein R3F46_00125 [bacterium]
MTPATDPAAADTAIAPAAQYSLRLLPEDAKSRSLALDLPEDPLAMLQAELESQLSRLDRQRSSSAVSAPGPDSVVFDLALDVLNPDDDGNMLELQWTEYFPGDYDGNGEVNIADLTPLARKLGSSVSYRDPDSTGGTAHWPLGDPAGPGSANWELARLDGNRDGLLDIADVTAVAQHWGQALEGYRVYRSSKGGKPELLAWPGLPDAALSVPREAAQLLPGGNRAYSFVDRLDYYGEARYFVRPCLASAGYEGPASAEAQYVRATELMPSLSADRESGVAPLRVEFSAGQTMLLGTSIERYSWDLDGDGEDDLSGTDGTVHWDFTESGSYHCRLRVQDGIGRSAEAFLDINVGDAPRFELELQDHLLSVGQYLVCDARVSPGSHPISLIELAMDGPAPYLRELQEPGSKLGIPLTTPGDYSVILRAVDSEGNLAQTTQQLRVLPRHLPQAVVAVLTEPLLPGQPIELDGSASSSMNGGIAAFEWQAPGAELLSHDNGSRLRLQYPVGGLKLLELTVTDQLGYRDTYEVALELAPLPVIKLLAGNEVIFGRQYGLNAYKSYALVGNSLTLDWDLDGDGEFEILNGEVLQKLIAPNERRTMLFNIRATDEAGNTATLSHSMLCIPEPEARVEIRDQLGAAGRRVLLDASSSVREDYSSYRWNYQSGAPLTTTEPWLELDMQDWHGSRWISLNVITGSVSSRAIYFELCAEWQISLTDTALSYNGIYPLEGLRQAGIALNQPDCSFIFVPIYVPSIGPIGLSRMTMSESGPALELLSLIDGAYHPIGMGVLNHQMHLVYQDCDRNTILIQSSTGPEMCEWQEVIQVLPLDRSREVRGTLLQEEGRLLLLCTALDDGIVMMTELRNGPEREWSQLRPVLQLREGFSIDYMEGAFIDGRPALACSSIREAGQSLNIYAVADDSSGLNWTGFRVMQLPAGSQLREMLELEGRPAALLAGALPAEELSLARAADAQGLDWSDLSTPPQDSSRPLAEELDISLVDGHPVIACWRDGHRLLIARDGGGRDWQPEVLLHDRYPSLICCTAVVLDMDGLPGTLLYGSGDNGYTNLLAEVAWPDLDHWSW